MANQVTQEQCDERIATVHHKLDTIIENQGKAAVQLEKRLTTLENKVSFSANVFKWGSNVVSGVVGGIVAWVGVKFKG